MNGLNLTSLIPVTNYVHILYTYVFWDMILLNDFGVFNFNVLVCQLKVIVTTLWKKKEKMKPGEGK